MKKKLLAITAIPIAGLVGAACSGGPSAVTSDQATSASILNQMETAQPSPKFSYSQIRQTLIDIETAQAKSTQTTSFFFNMGVASPVMSCPSVGFPVATTDQLTNPQQAVGINNGGQGNTAIGQIDPNGVYSGDSTGTYVLCIGTNGQTYGVYWEGFVYSLTGPAVWDPTSGSVKPTGPTSFHFTTNH